MRATEVAAQVPMPANSAGWQSHGRGLVGVATGPSGSGLDAVDHQLPAVGPEPFATPVHGGQRSLDSGPESLGVVHLDQVRYLVGRHVVENVGWRHNQPPVEVEPAVGRAGTPAGRLAAQ